MTITINQAINSLPYYTQKRSNKMPNRLTFCFKFHSTFLFSEFVTLYYDYYQNLVCIGGVLRSYLE